MCKQWPVSHRHHCLKTDQSESVPLGNSNDIRAFNPSNGHLLYTFQTSSNMPHCYRCEGEYKTRYRLRKHRCLCKWCGQILNVLYCHQCQVEFMWKGGKVREQHKKGYPALREYPARYVAGSFIGYTSDREILKKYYYSQSEKWRRMF